MNNKVLGIAIGVIGLLIIAWSASWQTAIGVWIMGWGMNLENGE